MTTLVKYFRIHLCILFFIFSQIVQAQVELIDDVHDLISQGTNADNFIKNSKYLFFRVLNKENLELWKSDGTQAGLKKVSVLRKLVFDDMANYQTKFVEYDNFVFFTVYKYDLGSELWKSNGDTTILVKTFLGNEFTISNLTLIGNNIYFSAADSRTTGSELWKSDGTTAGTKLVRDINVGVGSSDPSNFIQAGSTTYFLAYIYRETILCKTDGYANGTKIVKRFSNGTQAKPNNFTAYKGQLYFAANDSLGNRELWTSNGTSSGTRILKKINSTGSSRVSNLRASGQFLFFQAGDASTSRLELYKTDGTPESTMLVKDINPIGSSAPEELTDINGTLFFSALSSTGRELWKSDGSLDGTVLVSDINPGGSYSNPKNIKFYNGNIYFSAYKAGLGYELWKTNGTTIGTKLVKDILRGANGSSPSEFINFNNDLYFSANFFLDPNDREVKEVGKINAINDEPIVPFSILNIELENPVSNICATQDKLFFLGSDRNHGTELWVSQGTSGSSHLVTDIKKGVKSSNIREMRTVDNFVYFLADDAIHGTELWRSDGTAKGTIRLSDFLDCCGISNWESYFRYIKISSGKIYFTFAKNGADCWLAQTDGTLNGTFIIKQVGSDYTFVYSFVGIGEKNFFVNNIESCLECGVPGKYELWQTEGTETSTKKILTADNISSLHYSAYYSSWVFNSNGELFKINFNERPTLLGKVGNQVQFLDKGKWLHFMSVLNGKINLGKTDLTESGTNIITPITPKGLPYLCDWEIEPMPDSGYYCTDHGYSFDFIGNYQDSLNLFLVYNQIWKSDGTKEGTEFLKTFPAYNLYYPYPGAGLNLFIIPGTPINLDGVLYFTVRSRPISSGSLITRLWRSDGTAENTFVLDDVYSKISKLGTTIVYDHIKEGPINLIEYKATKGTIQETMVIEETDIYKNTLLFTDFKSVNFSWPFIVKDNVLYFWGRLIDSNSTYVGNELFKYSHPADVDFKISNEELVSNVESNDIKIFPMPVNSTLNIEMQLLEKVNTLKILDIQGRCVKEAKVNDNNAIQKIEIGYLQPGIYILQFSLSDGVIRNKKFIKE